MTIDELIKLSLSKDAADLVKLNGFLSSQGLSVDQIDAQIKMLKKMGGSSGGSFSSGGLSGDDKGFFRGLLGNGATGAMFDFTNSATKLLADQLGSYFESQFGKAQPTDSLKLFELIKKNGLDILSFTGDALVTANNMILEQLKTESELRSDIATKTGLSGELSEALREDMKTASIEAARYGVTLKDIGQFFIELVDQTGRFSMINAQMYGKMIPLTTALDMSLSEFSKTVADFEKVGIGADKTISSLEEVTTRSLSFGLSAKSIAKGITENIDKLNSFGFKNGVEGLEQMVRRSKEFRFTMDQVFNVAEKVFEPEGAIEMVANLQMIGGAIGDLNDPMRLLYMSTNDIEGLQEAIIGAADSIATYNEEQGRFEITGVNLRRAKAQADALGMSYTEFSKLAIAAAERTQAAMALSSRGLTIKEDDKEFLTNLSRMEGGEMKITIPEALAKKLEMPTKIALKDISDDVAQQLLLNKKAFEEMSTEDIAMQQLTETQRMAKAMDVVATYARVRGAELVRGGARGIGENLFKDLQTAIDEFSLEVKANASNNIEEQVRQNTKGVINNIQDTFVNKPKEMFNNLFNKEEGKQKEPLSQAQTFRNDTTITLRVPNMLDPMARMITSKPEVFMYSLTQDPREYTST